MTTRDILLRAKAATATLSTLTTEKKNAALLAMADALVADTAAVLSSMPETARSRAAPSPAAPGRFSVPPRWFRSWAPPWIKEQR